MGTVAGGPESGVPQMQEGTANQMAPGPPTEVPPEVLAQLPPEIQQAYANGEITAEQIRDLADRLQ